MFQRIDSFFSLHIFLTRTEKDRNNVQYIRYASSKSESVRRTNALHTVGDFVGGRGRGGGRGGEGGEGGGEGGRGVGRGGDNSMNYITERIVRSAHL